MLQGSITESGAGRVQSEVFFFFSLRKVTRKPQGEDGTQFKAEGPGNVAMVLVKKMPVVGA